MIKLPRAFLSHSSTDKAVVGEVAKILGRAAVIYDAFEFSAGDQFRDAILKGLERSDIFVLFASSKALQRDWVKFEISSASEALTKQALSRVVTYIIDPDLNLNDIPDWMKSTLIVKQTQPGLIATDIRRMINRRVADRTPTYFVGRRNEMEQALGILSEFTSPEFRPPLLVYGLGGIGRRSLVQIIGRDHLSFSNTLPVVLRSGDLLPEAFVRLSEAISPRAIPDYKAAIADQEAKSDGEQIQQILDLLRSVCDARTLPVLVDEGAMATPNGVLRPEFEQIYDAIALNRDVDAMIVTRRRLYGAGGKSLPSLRVPELDQSSTQNLLRIAGRDVGLSFEREALTALATYTRGYPPAVKFALDEARTRGVAQVVANQRALVNFSAELFLRQLKQERSLTPTMVTTLQLLSGFSPLPMPVIAEYCEISSEQASSDVDHLLDLAFILPDGLHYRITEPLRDAAYRAFDGLFIELAPVVWTAPRWI
ncbi:hypothetical protein ACVIW2_001983 [Bradyrhizobium huanghuaihaiense]